MKISMSDIFLGCCLLFAAIGLAKADPFSPHHQANTDKGLELIGAHVICFKCESGKWPASLNEMRETPNTCDTSYLVAKGPDGNTMAIPNLQFLVKENQKFVVIIMAGEGADMNNLSLKDNFMTKRYAKENVQCAHNKAN